MDLSERKLKILQAIIDDFIHSAEPVGSRTISKKYDLGVSPATIRNEMSDLEEMGYIKQPHTSAGRVPSDKAYRLYVDNLMNKYVISDEQKNIIKQKIMDNLVELDKTIEKASSLLSQMTNLTSFAITPKIDENRLEYIKLIPIDQQSVLLMIVTESGNVNNTVLKLDHAYTEENLNILSKVLTYNYKGKSLSTIIKMEIIKTFEDDIETMHKIMQNVMPNFLHTLENMLNVHLYMDGLTNIFSLPEYYNIDKAKEFLEILNQKEHFTEVLINRENGVVITIGQENKDSELKDCSLITATYSINGETVGKIGVIGPTRMKYSKVTSIVEYMTENLSNAFKINSKE